MIEHDEAPQMITVERANTHPAERKKQKVREKEKSGKHMNLEPIFY